MKQSDYINIIVVDDEPISADEMCELIRNTFSTSIHIHVRSAYNGASVLRMIEESPCDILVSDIQMPGMTGLALAKTLKEKHPDTFILFLTGFDDFNYAYEAIQQNAAHYILKTEGDESILKAIRETIDELISRRQMLSRIHDAESRYAQMVPAYRKQLLTQLLLGEDTDESLLELNRNSCDHIYAVIARSDSRQRTIPPRLKLTALSTVERTVADTLNGILLWYESILLDNTYVWIFSLCDGRECADSLFHLVRKARIHLEEQLSLPLFFVVADQDVTIRHLHEKYLELHSMLSREILRDAAGAAIRHTSSISATPPPFDDLRHSLNQCLRDIKENAFDTLEIHLAPLLKYLHGTQNTEDPCCAECMAALTYAMLSHINRNKLYAVLSAADHQAARGTAKWLDVLARELRKESQKKIDREVLSIAQYVSSYIREHISEDIGTSVLAEVSGYSSGYLSRVFKQHTGMSIHEYITQTRMNLARELLSNTKLRVYEIASACGYDNTTYFIKVFKSQTGQTPQEYKQHLADDFRNPNPNRMR